MLLLDRADAAHTSGSVHGERILISSRPSNKFYTRTLHTEPVLKFANILRDRPQSSHDTPRCYHGRMGVTKFCTFRSFTVRSA